MTPEQLASLAGIILSLGFSYVPGLSDWYGALVPTSKRIIMALLLLGVAVGAFALSCASVVNEVQCTREGVLGLVSAFIAALIANQSAFLLSPKPSKS